MFSSLKSSCDVKSLADCRLELQECEAPIIREVANIMEATCNDTSLDIENSDGLKFHETVEQNEFSQCIIPKLQSLFRVANISLVSAHTKDRSLTRLLLCCQDRVNMGASVARAKFRDNPDLYRNLVLQGKIKSARESLTDIQVEQALLDRLKHKTRRMLQGHAKSNQVASLVSELYDNILIPLTKDIQVDVISKLVNRTHSFML